MATTKLRAGEEITTLTADELAQHLDRQTADWFREQARSVSTFHIQDNAIISGGTATLPAGTSIGYGPDTGFAWAVVRLTAGNLAAADVVKVYWDAVAAGNFVGQLTGASPSLNFGSKGLILRGGRRLILQGTGLTATGSLYLTGEGMEIAESDIYKLL